MCHLQAGRLRWPSAGQHYQGIPTTTFDRDRPIASRHFYCVELSHIIGRSRVPGCAYEVCTMAGSYECKRTEIRTMRTE